MNLVKCYLKCDTKVSPDSLAGRLILAQMVKSKPGHSKSIVLLLSHANSNASFRLFLCLKVGD